MKKLILFAAVAGLGLISASPPASDHSDGPREARSGYPPCSRTVTDNCIQLYERGMRAPANLAANRKPEDEDATTDRAGYDGDCDRCSRGRRVLAQRIRRAGERG